MSTLVDRFLKNASPKLRQAFAFACADRAVRVYAVWALRAEGSIERARLLERLAPVTDKDRAILAVRTADTIYSSFKDTEGAAAHAVTNASDACRYATDVLDIEYILAIAGSSEDAAYHAYSGDWSAEGTAQEAWIAEHWEHWRGVPKPLTRDTLAAVDAYIADGLLLGDDE